MTDEAEQKRLDTVHNERTKLTATWLNGIAIAIYAVGGFAPFVTAILSGTALSVGLLALMSICPAISIAVHFVARKVLRGLK